MNHHINSKENAAVDQQPNRQRDKKRNSQTPNQRRKHHETTQRQETKKQIRQRQETNGRAARQKRDARIPTSIDTSQLQSASATALVLLFEQMLSALCAQGRKQKKYKRQLKKKLKNKK